MVGIINILPCCRKLRFLVSFMMTCFINTAKVSKCSIQWAPCSQKLCLQHCDIVMSQIHVVGVSYKDLRELTNQSRLGFPGGGLKETGTKKERGWIESLEQSTQNNLSPVIKMDGLWGCTPPVLYDWRIQVRFLKCHVASDWWWFVTRRQNSLKALM